MSLEGQRGIRILGDTTPMRINSETTANRRLIGEYSSNEEYVRSAIRRGVNMRLAPNPAEDYRKGKPMNRGSLQDIVNNWPDIMNNIVWLHDRFIGEASEGTTTHDFFRTAAIGASVPVYFFNRAEGRFPLYDKLPSSIGAIPKITNGFRTIGGLMTYSNPQEVAPYLPVTPESIYEFAVDGRWLTSADKKRFCAGPKPMIIAAGKALLYGEGGKAQESILETEISDTQGFKDFAEAFFEWDKTVPELNMGSEKIIREMVGTTHPARLVNLLQQYEQFEEQQIARWNLLQKRINLGLGYDESKIPELTQADIQEEVEVTPRDYMKQVYGLLG